jgi:hypothetical protein
MGVLMQMLLQKLALKKPLLPVYVKQIGIPGAAADP